MESASTWAAVRPCTCAHASLASRVVTARTVSFCLEGAGPDAPTTKTEAKRAATHSLLMTASASSGTSSSAAGWPGWEGVGEDGFDAPDSASTSSSVSLLPFEFLSSPSLSLLDPLSAARLAASARRCSARSCCAREVNGHRSGARASLVPEADREAHPRSGDVAAAVAAAVWSHPDAIMAV